MAAMVCVIRSLSRVVILRGGIFTMIEEEVDAI